MRSRVMATYNSTKSLLLLTVAWISGGTMSMECIYSYQDLRNCSCISEGVFDCSDRSLRSIPAFPNWTIYIDLSGNNIETFSTVLVGLEKLKSLNLSSNKLDNVCTNALSELDSLDMLDISGNKLTEHSFPTSTFASTKSLRTLYIQNNVYNRYPSAALGKIVSLNSLHIDVFDSFRFDEKFLNMRNLSDINFYNRNKFSLKNNTFIGLSNSPILYLELLFGKYLKYPLEADVLRPFKFLKGIRIKLRLSGSIKDALFMLHGLRYMRMEFINLSDNVKEISIPISLTYEDIAPLMAICVRNVNLNYNDIVTFPIRFDSISPFVTCLENISFTGNDLIGGNLLPLLQLLYFPSIISVDLSNMNRIVSFHHDDYISGNQGDADIFKHIERTLNHHVPNITFNTSWTLRNINMSSLYLHNKHDPPEDRVIVVAPALQSVDLSFTKAVYCRPGFSLSFITDVRYLDISGWTCSKLNPIFLSSIQTLETLIFRSSSLENGLQMDTDGILLHGLSSLATVDLSENDLQIIHEDLFRDQYLSLKHAILDNNKFDHIPICLSGVHNLELLSFRNNRITSFSPDDRSRLRRLRKVRIFLRGNRFDCTCDNLDSLKWMNLSAGRIVDFRDLRCTDEMYVGNVTTNIHEFELHCISTFWLKLSVTLLVLCLCIIVISAVILKHRVKLEYLYLRLRMVVHRSKVVSHDKQFTFDVFVSYSHHDTDWVVDILYKRLETDMNAKVCIHHKDFQVGHWISDEIIRCIDESRYVVFVITRHFLDSNWSTYEMEMAKMHAFRSDRTGLIIIMKESLPLVEMPKSLKKIWWRVVCLEWPQNNYAESETLFWNKLKVALEL